MRMIKNNEWVERYAGEKIKNIKRRNKNDKIMGCF